MAAIYIASVLLERNRWRPGKQPSYQVSDWLDRFAKAGFDGIELWENHAAMAPVEEVARLQASALPVQIYNSYATFEPNGGNGQALATQFVRAIGAPRVKFNVGNDPAQLGRYLGQVEAWYHTLPAGTVLLCECHPGTVLETPERAADAFARWHEAGVAVEAIVHPFNLDLCALQAWFGYLGPAITHAHVQLHRDGKMQSLVPYANYVRDHVRLMHDAGFSGSFTLEFTEGVGLAQEDMEQLFTSACRDLDLLRGMVGQWSGLRSDN